MTLTVRSEVRVDTTWLPSMYRGIKGATYDRQVYELLWRIHTRDENEDDSSCDEVDYRAAEQNISIFL
jgi:hypothetical protein